MSLSNAKIETERTRPEVKRCCGTLDKYAYLRAAFCTMYKFSIEIYIRVTVYRSLATAINYA